MLKTLTLAVPLALAAAACSGVSGGSGAGSSRSGATIVIGATLSLTGSLDVLGSPLEAGYKQEIAAVNAAGGIAIGGREQKLRLVVLDNGSDPSTASSQASELVRKDHAAALLGFASPQIVTATALVAEQLRVPFLTSLMPVEAFANGDKDGWKYSWDFFYDERQQAADVAKALASVPSNKKVVLFTDNEPDGVVERPLYKAAFEADGLDVVGDYTFPVGTTDFSSFIAAARAKGAQLLAGQMAPADGVALWKQLKSFGFRPRAAFLANASDSGYWWQSLGSLAQDTLSDSDWSPSQASPGQLATITPALGKKYAGNPTYPAAALAYAVAEVLTDALAKAGSTSPGKLNIAISQTNAQTTAGPIRFNLSTHTAITPCSITQWRSGKLVQVKPLARGATFDVPTAGLSLGSNTRPRLLDLGAGLALRAPGRLSLSRSRGKTWPWDDAYP
jgi:branched-chain amino acid transport system substrate-binding protein